MRIRSTVHPGHRGAKKELTQYGDRLVCVRYRYDEQRHRRLKTVELIVEEEAWTPFKPPPPADVLVPLRIAPAEVTLRQQVKQLGGRWDPRRQVWEVRYAQAVALGVAERILDSKGL
ncbi:MAG TPA: hypothetical protein VKK81_13985 [Candidatus Binatia bacterium]|nr:hypothetical protein [Candidatus Binatia bacterium]